MPVCTIARCKMEIQELEQGLRCPCPAVAVRTQPFELWVVGGAARTDIWGLVAVAAAPKRG